MIAVLWSEALRLNSSRKPKHRHLQLNHGTSTRIGCPGALKAAATEAHLAQGTERAPWSCWQVTQAAGRKPRTTSTQATHRTNSREVSLRSQAGFDGNLLRCPVLKSFGRCVRTGLFLWNISVPANKPAFNGRNISAQKLWPDSQRSTVC